ncbi:RRM domain-containing protein [Citrus sinensis]|uniref:RRM domain-containing protein n=1 Tax=Citrus sinensis TaxID=2711 RepID=A0ACB8LFY4_CITSI|nr:RRM domain-containing protein [Citrus sinensis]KAH9772347.1 RRM domain-containing protein [Citrus sinensis]
MANLAVQKNTLYVGGLAEEVNEAILHAAFIPFGDIKDVKTPLDQATQKHRSFGFVTFLEKEDAIQAMDNMDGAELYGRVLTVNYALPERIKGGEQGWAAQPSLGFLRSIKTFSISCHFSVVVWADADTWFERQQQEEEMQRLQAENRAAMQAAEELHRKKMAEDREGEKEEDSEMKDDPMARAEAEVLKQNNSS